jgi:hypothetical protein
MRLTAGWEMFKATAAFVTEPDCITHRNTSISRTLIGIYNPRA